MKKGRVAVHGSIHEVTAHEDGLMLEDGRIVAESEVNWLPPVQPETTFALGLNYADHASELAFEPPKEPLVFLKGKNTIIGHEGRTKRPVNATHMHYECELAVVIGKAGKHISEEEAYDYITGYTIANDYAIRDFLENYYRPNMRVKNRDTCTPLGPWLTPKKEIPDPMNLTLTTKVNGKLTQEGSTRDMVFSVPFLVSYLSQFMTLSPGDVILTGTPKGLAKVEAGDVVETEIEGLGSLKNTIIESREEIISVN
ncbi:fumarylacetoacetate hydrolase family protein [Salsuginibacillus kocurii]|uniref:fumarylacetoacetate hydrolase family protein n=1 Tax=Salsuginibacillus kocurii TaxID=427078 RepID=UPI000476337C|nr:fumarylacetoacetate hydrolase family protein [Salsuginibacillus kocurii]